MANQETKKHGGVRPGSGRKKLEAHVVVQSIKEKMRDFANEIVSVKTVDGKVLKRTRSQVLLAILYEEAIKNKNIPAIKEFYDRTQGKAEQPLLGDTDDGVLHIKLDT